MFQSRIHTAWQGSKQRQDSPPAVRRDQDIATNCAICEIFPDSVRINSARQGAKGLQSDEEGPPEFGEPILATSNCASKLAQSKRFAWHADEGEAARASVWSAGACSRLRLVGSQAKVVDKTGARRYSARVFPIGKPESRLRAARFSGGEKLHRYASKFPELARILCRQELFTVSKKLRVRAQLSAVWRCFVSRWRVHLRPGALNPRPFALP